MQQPNLVSNDLNLNTNLNNNTKVLGDQPILRVIDAPVVSQKKSFMQSKSFVLISVITVLLLGTGSGFLLSKKSVANTGSGSTSDANLQRTVETGDIGKGTKVGIADEKTFKDSAEGDLAKGGMEGEGSHHLVRPGGADQTLYMTSSVIDLDQFVGKKVKVWGETLGAQKAGWLMDVGKLEVIE